MSTEELYVVRQVASDVKDPLTRTAGHRRRSVFCASWPPMQLLKVRRRHGISQSGSGYQNRRQCARSLPVSSSPCSRIISRRRMPP